jgi:hypothetical protein
MQFALFAVRLKPCPSVVASSEIIAAAEERRVPLGGTTKWWFVMDENEM